jgi:hypothetical protein
LPDLRQRIAEPQAAEIVHRQVKALEPCPTAGRLSVADL